MKILIATILLMPLLGFLFNTFFCKKKKGDMAGIVASISVSGSLIPVLILFIQILRGNFVSQTVVFNNWLHAGSLKVPFEFLVDPLSVTMMLIITGVGLLIHIYSIGYMRGDERIGVFFANMNLFIFSMLLLVMAGNYLLMFAGWEGVGLCSYLLIGFWSSNDDFNYAARKAFIMNRIGDLGFLLGMILLFVNFGSLGFAEITSKASVLTTGNSMLTLSTILLLIGALGKSAQIPLFTWLPDAMAGPTPVSALIHAATMVTAGIYLVARAHLLFVLSPVTMNIILLIGVTTAIFAAVVGIMKNDIKKVLAYSTVSQLGYMFTALGLGAFTSSIFHLGMHAFFKALLFLAAGSVIHGMQGEQDIRKMGGLKKYFPLTLFTFIAGTLAISGIPPFSGFFSKDEILKRAFENSPVLWIVTMAGALLTCFYMFRLLYLTFYGKSRYTSEQAGHFHESPKVMTIPLIILAILSFGGGFINIPSVFGGHTAFAGFLKPVFADIPLNNGHLQNRTELILVAASLVLLLSVILFAYFIYIRKAMVPATSESSMNPVQKTILHKFYIDEIYAFLFEKPYQWLSENLFRTGEIKIIDNFVNSFGRLVNATGNRLQKVQNGSIKLYLFVMAAGLILILILNFFVF
ncbi:MAG: NADH-quinone oxidoreductase subunit L [Bacteroidia bacterium]|nr:NADH-quinone oxidoreductase subunit L [Bacteroidia bacterium]